MYRQEGYRSMNLMHQVVYPLVSPQACCLQKENQFQMCKILLQIVFFCALSLFDLIVHLVIWRGHEGGSMREVSHAHFESIICKDYSNVGRLFCTPAPPKFTKKLAVDSFFNFGS